VEFERVLDFRDGEICRVLVVSEKRMLSEPWPEEQRKGHEALTQALGRLAYDLDVQALLVPFTASHEPVGLPGFGVLTWISPQASGLNP
jgi:hypothetical protein